VNLTYVVPVTESKTKKTTETVNVDKNKNKTPGKDKENVPLEKTEKYWRDLKNGIELKIQKIEEEIKQDEERLTALQNDLIAQNFVTMQLQEMQAEIEKVNELIDMRKRGIESLRQELEDLYENARRAGVPPGWLR